MPVALAVPAIDIAALFRPAIWVSENPRIIQNAMSTSLGLWNTWQILERSKPKSPSLSAPARGSMKSSGGSVLPPDPDQDPRKERKETTHQEQKDFVQQRLDSGEWEATGHKINGRPAYRDVKTGKYYTKDKRHADLEQWHVSGKKARHEGSAKCEEGLPLYKKPTHGTQKFE